MLQSAIGYLQLAGITVQAMNQANGLTLVIPNAHYCTNDDGVVAAFRIGTPSAPNNGTPTEVTARTTA